MPLKTVVLEDPVDLGLELRELGVERGAVARGERAVRRLHRQLAEAVEDAADLVEGALGGLRQGDAVHGVPAGDVVRADLGAHALGDREAGGVVGRDGDTKAGGESGVVALEAAGGDAEVPLGGQRGDVGVDAKSHDDACGEWFRV